MRTCTWCDHEAPDFPASCPHCEARPTANEPDPERMTGEERAGEMRRFHSALQVRFPLMHARIEALVGRPVWTHELALRWDALVEEARTRQHATLDDVIGSLVATGKPVIVVAVDEEAGP